MVNSISFPSFLGTPWYIYDSCTVLAGTMSNKSIAKKATAGTISIDEMAGGTFTISNGRVYGSLLSTPIINPPQSAIFGMHSIVNRPMGVGGEVVSRPLMYIALTYDYRQTDGREAVLFLRRIKDVVEDPRRLLLDIEVRIL